MAILKREHGIVELVFIVLSISVNLVSPYEVHERRVYRHRELAEKELKSELRIVYKWESIPYPNATVIAPDGYSCVKVCNKSSRDTDCVKHSCCMSWSTICIVSQAKDRGGYLRDLRRPEALERHYTIRVKNCTCSPECQCSQPIDHVSRCVEVLRKYFPSWCPMRDCPKRDCCWVYRRVVQPGCGKCVNGQSRRLLRREMEGLKREREASDEENELEMGDGSDCRRYNGR